MAQSYPVVRLNAQTAQADIPARTAETAIRVFSGMVRLAYGTESIENAMPLTQGEGWIIPANTALRVYHLSGEPAIYQMDTV